MRDAHADATFALANYWQRNEHGGPLIPVDPIQIARNLGLDVYASELNTGTSGVLVKQNGGIPTIHVSARDALVRQRFTCAHEIGHYWCRGGGPNFGYVDKRDTLARAGTDPDEIYANAFAAELLMPTDVVTQLYRGGVSPEQQASMLVVSLEAMRIRFETLKLG